MTSQPGPEDALTIAQQGDVLVVTPAPVLRYMDSTLVEGAAAVILQPLDAQPAPLVVVDLSHVPVFGTAFLAMLIRCWKRISQGGGTLALASCSPDVLNLLRMTRFDTIWPLYDSAPEAVAALMDD